MPISHQPVLIIMLHENCVDYVVVAHPNPQNIPSDGPCYTKTEKKIQQKNVKRKGTKTKLK